MKPYSIPDSLRLGFIGGGNMAQSLIGGLLANGVKPAQIVVSDPSEQCREAIASLGVSACENNDKIVSESDIVVLAVKPQITRDVLTPLAAELSKNRPLLISIAAGIGSEMLQQWTCREMPIIRCMPNTPALLQQGATALFANDVTSDIQRAQAQAILQAVGLALWVEDEGQLDAVTALSGSGPAYFFLLIELMQAAGEELGLDGATARQLTLQTALGAATMAANADVDASELRRRVTSPNGTTHAAVQSFLQSGLEQTVAQALQAAHRRSVELAEELAG